MPLYTVKVAVKYEQEYVVEAPSKEAAEEAAIDTAYLDVAGAVEFFPGCPYVIETREPKEAK